MPGPPSIEDQIRARIDRTLLEHAPADERTILLARLIKSCNLVNVLYERNQRKLVNQRIDALAANTAYTSAVDQAVAGAQAAVNAAIIAASLSATTSACSTTAADCQAAAATAAGAVIRLLPLSISSPGCVLVNQLYMGLLCSDER